jgi:uncharacterized protein
MARETDTTPLPDASEERIIECPVCSNTMTTMSAEGVTVDVCAGGCGGIWFDWFELARVDEVHESAGEKFLEVERDPTLHPDLSKRIHCPRDSEIMMRHFHSVKRGVVVDECPRCAGFWLDAGELAGIRSEFATQEERKQAAQEYFSELFDPDLAVEVIATAGATESTMCAKSATWEGAAWVRTRSSPARSSRWWEHSRSNVLNVELRQGSPAANRRGNPSMIHTRLGESVSTVKPWPKPWVPHTR